MVFVAVKTYHVHVDAIGVRPVVLEALLQAGAERLGDVVEGHKVLDALQLLVQLVAALVHAQHDGRHVPEYRRTQEG